jgi:hypothetical protein
MRRLDRLLEVRRIAEDVERSHLLAAHTAVSVVEAARERQQQAIEGAAASSADALGRGHRNEWLFAEAQSEVAAGNRARLLPLLSARRAGIAPATAAYLEKRRELRQIQQLVAEGRERQRLSDGRRAQAAADDWFLARRLRKPR